MGELWPLLVREAAQEVFGGYALNPKGRTFKALNLRVQHAFSVWGRRYAMTPQQYEYAGTVLAWAMKKAHTPDKPYPYNLKAVCNEMERVVNDEQAHSGFKRRADLVDVRKQLAELVA